MEKRINLMHVVLSLNIGGLENLVLKLVKNINREKYNICICSLTANGELENEFNEIGIPVFIVQKHEGVDYSLPIRLSRVFRNRRVDIVHTHNIDPYLYGTIGAKLARVPVIIHTEHSNLFPNQKKLMIAERCLSNISDMIIADSKKVADFLIQRQNIPRRKVITILNAIDIDSFDVTVDIIRKKREELGILENELVIGNVARLVPVKDHHTLLASFSKVSQLISNVRLVIVGDGPLRTELENFCAELELSDKIIFLGKRRDISELMSIFDIFVLSSISEGLSLTLLEAMAAKKPVVATHVGGNPEVVQDNVTGILVPPRNPLALAQALIILIKDKKKLFEMGESGRRRVEQYFSIDVMLEKYEKVYRSSLQKKGIYFV
ncbi:MAG: glycosyltransferase family 4 protein [bacterium]